MTNESSKAGFNCIAIGYCWTMVSPGIDKYDVVLSLAVCESQITPSTRFNKEVYDNLPCEVNSYFTKLPPQDVPIEQSNVSGTLGLLWPSSDKLSEARAAAFERSLSDLIQWMLAGRNIDESKPTVVLLQGPLIPKLRGRFLYCGLSDKVSILSITYQPEWLKRFEAVENITKRLKEGDKAGIILGSIYPPKGVDQSTRSWVSVAQGRIYHFEAISNQWDCCTNNDTWINSRENEIKLLLNVLKKTGTSMPLPAPLDKSIQAARKANQKELNYVLVEKHIETCRNIGTAFDSIKGLNAEVRERLHVAISEKTYGESKGDHVARNPASKQIFSIDNELLHKVFMDNIDNPSIKALIGKLKSNSEK